jgi:putative ABC transport system permease protein
MLFSLLLRNLSRNLPRLRPMIIVLTLAFAFLVLGNSISLSINSGYEQVYTELITADFSLSPSSDRNYTIFGSEALVVGELLSPPTFADFESLQPLLDEDPAIEAYAGVVTVAGRLDYGGKAHYQPLLGVDFASYANVVPDFSLIEGSFPKENEPGILISSYWLERLSGESSPKLGDLVSITVAIDNDFTIREVPITGIYQYPISNSLLDRLGIIDVETARSLNGYINSTTINLETDSLFGTMDDLFAVEDPLNNPDEVNDPFVSLFDNPSPQKPSTISTAWNFLLLDTKPNSNLSGLQTKLNQLFPENTINLKNWRETAGGNAVLNWILQIIFNLGMIFIAIGASIVTINALVLSVLERIKEIGTMRALGASQGKVATIISGETIFVVIGSSIFGLVIGSFFVILLNSFQIELSNEFLSGLFGSSLLSGTISISLLLEHLLLGFILGLISIIYPLKKALAITPLKAMTNI